MEDTGGPAYISSLTDGVPHGFSAAAYIKELQRVAAHRQLALNVYSLHRRFQSGTGNPVELYEHFKTVADPLAGEVASDTSTATLTTLADALPEFLDRLATRHGQRFRGLSTGDLLEPIDEALFGWRGFLLVGGLPGIGKTSLATNVGFDVLEHHDRTCPDGSSCFVFVSIEMSADDIYLRLLSQTSGLPWRIVANGNLSEDKNEHDGFQLSPEQRVKWEKGVRKLEALGDRLIIRGREHIPANGFVSPARWLTQLIEQAKTTTGTTRAFALLDYLQVIPVQVNSRMTHPLDREAFIVDELVKVARANPDDPLVVITRLPKSAFGRAREGGSDLGSVSGSVGAVYAADTVMFLEPSAEPAPKDDQSCLELKIEKG